MDIGILLPFPVDQMDPKNSLYLKRLAEIAHLRGIRCLLFTLEDTDLEQNQVHAHTLAPTGESTFHYNGPYSLPPVIYNRLDTNYLATPEARAVFEHFVRHLYLQRPQIKIFNLHHINKYEFYRLFSHIKELNRYLPDTQIYDPQALSLFLEKHKSILLKPFNLSLGKGICQINKENGSLLIKFRVNKQLYHGHSPDLATLLKFLPQVMLQDQYLMQERVDLATLDDNPIFFRVHLFKKQKAAWRISAISGRVGNKHDYLVTYTAGAVFMEYRTLLQQVFGANAKKVEAEIIIANLLAAQILDAESPYLLGELGADIAVAKNGEVKIIEINYKPGWSQYDDTIAIQTQICHHFLDFCTSLPDSE
ncbi:MAG: YheC/YheD family protein [bacterium]